MAIARSIFGAVLAACSIGLAAAQAPATTAQAPAGTPQSGIVSAGKGNPYNFARGVPARIVDFQAEPASIQPGQSATLTWSTEDPTGITIDPDLGRVAARGVVKVTPSRTTTYTLTVLGPNDQKLTRTVTVNVAGTTPVTARLCLGSDQEGNASNSGWQTRLVGSLGRRRRARRARRECRSRSTGPKARRGEVQGGPRPRRYGPIFGLHAVGRAAGRGRALSF